MSDFINTVDTIDDDVLIDSLIDRSFSGSFNDDKITSIRSRAFSYCTNLESVCFPSVTSIGESAFNGSGLKVITPDTFPLVTTINGTNIFANSALETVEFPSLTGTPSGAYMFQGCKSLRSISCPNWKTMGGNNSYFSNCISLTDVDLPAIAVSPSFSDCTALRTITLPSAKSVTSAFAGCTSLQVVDLPTCEVVGGQHGFPNCPLKALILRSTTMCTLNLFNNGQVMYLPFNGAGIASGAGYVYVPSALIDSYKTDANWNIYASQYRFRPLEDYTIDGTITGEMREHCESLSLNTTELTFTDENSYTLIPAGNFGILDRISWESSDTTVVRVNKNGVVTPIGDGSATITVRFGEYTATCAVTVNAGLERAENNILDGVGFNSGSFDASSVVVTGNRNDVYTDKFDITPYIGKSIEVQLIDVYSTEPRNRLCYFDANNKRVGYAESASTASYGAVITSNVHANATYAAISVDTNLNFSSIEIFCDGALIGHIDYIP